MSLRSDALLGVTGILPKEITPKNLEDADALPERWTRHVRSWIGAEQAPFRFVEPRGMDSTFDKLAADPSESEVTAWLGILPDDEDIGVSYYPALLEARHYLVNQWPRLTIDGPAGPRLLPMSPDDVAEVWSVLQILNDADRFLHEMDAGTLTTSQAEAFRACLPDLSALVENTIRSAIGERRAKDLNYDLPASKESVFRTIIGMPPEDYFAPPPKPAPVPSKFKVDTDSERTQAEVSSAPKSAKST